MRSLLAAIATASSPSTRSLLSSLKSVGKRLLAKLASPQKLIRAVCRKHKSSNEFSSRQWIRRARRCKECCNAAAATSGHTRSKTACSFYGASLMAGENKEFCCVSGKHAVDFSKYFQSPCKRLMTLYKKTWKITSARRASNCAALDLSRV